MPNNITISGLHRLLSYITSSGKQIEIIYEHQDATGKHMIDKYTGAVQDYTIDIVGPLIALRLFDLSGKKHQFTVPLSATFTARGLIEWPPYCSFSYDIY